MEIAFETKQLRTLCESEAIAKRELDATVAEHLKHRLSDLRAATSPKDLLAGKPKPIFIEGQEYMQINLDKGFRLVISPNHPNNPHLSSGKIDWSKVNRIKIMRIESAYVK